jgi:site-specific recombinase XerD
VKVKRSAKTASSQSVRRARKKPRVDPRPVRGYLDAKSQASRRSLAYALDVVAKHLGGSSASPETLDWSRIEEGYLDTLQAYVYAHYAPTSGNLILGTFRAVAREAWRLGLISAETFQKAAELKSRPVEAASAGRVLKSADVVALFRAAGADGPLPRRARDATLLAIMYGAGLRRSEVVTLDLTDYTPRHPFGPVLLVGRDRGVKQRLERISEGANAALADWVLHRGQDSGPLLLPVDKSGAIEHRRLTPQSVRDILVRLALAAGVGPVSPNDLRRTFISELLATGADVRRVQERAGHSSVATTVRYFTGVKRSGRPMAEMLEVPYEPPDGHSRAGRRVKN